MSIGMLTFSVFQWINSCDMAVLSQCYVFTVDLCSIRRKRYWIVTFCLTSLSLYIRSYPIKLNRSWACLRFPNALTAMLQKLPWMVIIPASCTSHCPRVHSHNDFPTNNQLMIVHLLAMNLNWMHNFGLGAFKQWIAIDVDKIVINVALIGFFQVTLSHFGNPRNLHNTYTLRTTTTNFRHLNQINIYRLIVMKTMCT